MVEVAYQRLQVRRLEADLKEADRDCDEADERFEALLAHLSAVVDIGEWGLANDEAPF
jgi:hypothetical protein